MRHRTLVLAIAALSTGLLTLTPAAAATYMVEVSDFQFTPSTYPIQLGDSIEWVWAGGQHRVRDKAAALRVIRSPLITGEGSHSELFNAAGTYPYICTEHAEMTGQIELPVKRAYRDDGTVRIRWAKELAPEGYVYDVELRAAGDTAWSDWKTGVTGPTAVFRPAPETTSYRFRARLRRVGEAKSGWSPPLAVAIEG